MASPGGVEVGRVSLRVVPDTSRLGQDLRVALERIEAQTELKVNASIDNTRLDADARAAVDQAQLAAGNLHIKAEVDTSQVRESELALGKAANAAQGFSSSIGGITAAVVILGPALIPVVAALAGLVAALAAPIAITAGGLTVFGFLAGFAVKDALAQKKTIDDLQKKLAGLKKGTAEYAQTQGLLRDATAAMSPAQKGFINALDNVKGAFRSLPQGVLLKPLTDAMKLLARVLPLATPIIKAASDALDGIIGQLDKSARSQGFKDFVSAFAKHLGPDIRTFADIAGNVFQGLFGLFGAFNDQLSGTVLSSLETLTGKFADWSKTVGQSKGFRAFVDYVKRIGPKVAEALGAIAGAAGDIVAAFAPVGSVVLGAITGLAHAISRIPSKVLEDLAFALVGIVASAKLLGPLAGLISSIIAAPEAAAAVALIVALAAGFTILYQNSKPLQRIVKDLGDFFREKLLPPIEDAAQNVIPAFHGALKDINQTLRSNRPYLETLGKALLVITAAAVIGGLTQVALAIRIMGKAFQVGVAGAKAWADIVLIALRLITRGFTVFVKFLLGVYGKIVDGAAKAFGWIPGIGGKVKAAQSAFHAFSDGVLQNLNRTGDRLKRLQDQIDGIHGPRPFKITVDDLQAVKRLEALQAFKLRDKSFTVTENFIERAPGPGGGINRPAPNSQQGVPHLSPDTAPQPSTRRTTGGTTINVNKVEAHDYNDFLKQLQRRARARAGGGVMVTP